MSRGEKAAAILILDGVADQLYKKEYESLRGEIIKGNMEVIDILRISTGERLMKDLASILLDLRPGKLPSVQTSSTLSSNLHSLAEAIVSHAQSTQSTTMP